MRTPPLFLTAFGKYYFNKKYWKGLDALDSYVTDQTLTEVCGKISSTFWCFEPALRVSMLSFCMLLTSQTRSRTRHLNFRYQHVTNGHSWSKCLWHHTTKQLAWWSSSALPEAQLPFIGDREDTLLAYLASAQVLSVLYSSLFMNILSLDILLRLWIEHEISVLNLTLLHDPRHCKG